MPCNCIPKVYAYPENSEWGPSFWILLHGLAERAGKTTDPLFQSDERRAWTHLLNTTDSVLPCPDCSKHYKEWLNARPVGYILTLPYSELREFLRQWLYTLHDNVNQRTGKTSIAYDELTQRYNSENIPASFKVLDAVEKRAIQLQGVRIQSWNNWVKQYKTLINIYGL